MAVFVIDEWLWADSSGENGIRAQGEAFNVIRKLAVSEHQIVVIEGSPFDQKAWSLCENTNPMIVQRIAGAYVAGVRVDLDRCLILKPEAVAVLPDELAEAIKPDDHYLVQAQLCVPGAILVTTDSDLCEAVRKARLECLSREQFLGSFF